MPEDSVVMHRTGGPDYRTGGPDSVFSTMISGMGNCNVHSKDALEAAASAAEGVQSNENCDVHSTDGNSDVHSIDVIKSVVDSVAGWNVYPNENCDVHSIDENCDVHSNDAIGPVADNEPTPQTYRELKTAYDFFNAELFDNKLPPCLITLQRRKSTYGFFAAKRFGRDNGQRTDEIALNPQHFAERTIEENLSTLAHEMKHLEQHHRGEPGRGRYHNKQWADMMETIGLIPSSTGKEGGKRTGDRVSHYIKPGGRFALAVEKLLATGFTITWREVTAQQVPAGGGNSGAAGSLSGIRIKFTCPDCGNNAWGKSGLNLMCGDHQKKMLPAL